MIFDTHPYQREQLNMTSANSFSAFNPATAGNSGCMNYNNVSHPSFPPLSSQFAVDTKKPSIQFNAAGAADNKTTSPSSPFTNRFNSTSLPNNRKHMSNEDCTEPSMPQPPPKKRRTMNDAFRHLSLQQQQAQAQQEEPSYEILDENEEGVITDASDNNISPIDRDDEMRRKLHYKLSSASSSSASLSSLASSSDCSMSSSSDPSPSPNDTPTTNAIMKYQSSNPVDDRIEDIIRQYRIKAYIQSEIQRRSSGRFLLKQEAENRNDSNMEVTRSDGVEIEEIDDDDDDDYEDGEDMISMET